LTSAEKNGPNPLLGPSWARTPVPVPDELMGRIVDRLDAFATRWNQLCEGGSTTLEWPVP